MDRTDNLIRSMNNIADVIAGEKHLYACIYDEDDSVKILSIGINEIKNFYTKSVAFYTSTKNYQEFYKDFFENLNLDLDCEDNDYWLGDFDKNGGGAGDLLFALAGRRID